MRGPVWSIISVPAVFTFLTFFSSCFIKLIFWLLLKKCQENWSSICPVNALRHLAKKFGSSSQCQILATDVWVCHNTARLFPPSWQCSIGLSPTNLTSLLFSLSSTCTCRTEWFLYNFSVSMIFKSTIIEQYSEWWSRWAFWQSLEQ